MKYPTGSWMSRSDANEKYPVKIIYLEIISMELGIRVMKLDATFQGNFPSRETRMGHKNCSTKWKKNM